MNMATDNLCHPILLAKNQCCKVIYCEEFDVSAFDDFYYHRAIAYTCCEN